MFLTPERIQDAMARQATQIADLNQRVFSWQLDQLALAEKQMTAGIKTANEAYKLSVDAASAWQKSMVDAFTPADDS